MKTYLKIATVLAFAIFTLLILTLTTCKQDDNDDLGKLISYEERNVLFQDVTTEFNDLLNSYPIEQARVLILNQIIQSDLVVNVGLSDDSSVVYWKTNDGIISALLIEFFTDGDDITLNNTFDLGQAANSNPKLKLSPHNNKALLLSPSYYDWSGLSSDPDKKDINYYFKRKLQDNGYEVTYKFNESKNQQNITLSDYESWNDYGIISFSGHGSIISGFGMFFLHSGIKLTEEFYNQHKLNFKNGEFYDAGDLSGKKFVFISSIWFGNTYDGIDNTFFLMSACFSNYTSDFSLYNNIVGDNSCYWGWDKQIWPHGGGWKCERFLIDKLLDDELNCQDALQHMQNTGNHRVLLIPQLKYSYINMSVNSNTVMKLLTNNSSNIPTVITSSITNPTQTSATSGGNVTSDGGATVTARGVCWSTSPNPTISDQHTIDGTGTGTFTSTLTNLTPNTPYHVRAYATNSEGTAYGNNLEFTTQGGTTAGLLAYYPFTGDANDVSGNGYHGTIEGATLTTDRFGNTNRAYYFDGVNDRITTSFKPTNINSISVWFYASPSQPFNSGIFSTYQEYSFNGYYFGFQRTTPEGALYYDGNFGIYISFPSWNEWVHLVVCSDGTTITVYINGTLFISFAGKTTHSGNLFIGESKYDSRFFKGKIDDIRIYDYPLSAAEVINLFNEKPL